MNQQMEKEKKLAIMSALNQAMRRESAAFNFYIKAASKAPYKETVSLFLQLAEEERKHKTYIKKELDRIQALIDSKSKDGKGVENDFSFHIPKFPDLKRIQPLPIIDMILVSLPTELLSGDHLDTFIIENKESSPSLGLFLHDVMGHGPEAANLSSLVKQFMGEVLETWHTDPNNINLLKPDTLMTQLNKNLTSECQANMKFITALFGVINYMDKMFSYASAGHEPPILIKSDGSYHHLDITELLIGADEGIQYSTIEVPIDTGDVLILYSDGITEITNKQEEMFERERIVEAAAGVVDTSAKEIVNKIFQALRNHVGDQPVKDDFSLAVLKIVKHTY